MPTTIAYEHRAEVTIGRRRKPQGFIFPSSLEADFRRVEPDEFPVAIRYPGALTEASRALDTVEMRALDGRLRRPICAPDTCQRPRLVTLSWFGSLTPATPKRFPLHRELDSNTDVRTNTPLSMMTHVTRTVSDDDEARRNQVLAWASDLVLCDGALWEPVPEPLLIADCYTKRFKIDERGDTNSISMTSHIPFRIDEGDFARQWIAMKLGDVMEPLPDILVTEAYSPTYDSTLRRLRTLASELWFSVPHATRNESAAIQALNALAGDLDAEEMPEAALTESLQRLAEALAAACAACRSKLPNRLESFRGIDVLAACEAEMDAYAASSLPDDPDLSSFSF